MGPGTVLALPYNKVPNSSWAQSLGYHALSPTGNSNLHVATLL